MAKPIVSVAYLPSNSKGLKALQNQGAILKELNSLTYEAGLDLAKYARKRLAAVLRRSHKFKVGVTDMASSNLLLQKGSSEVAGAGAVKQWQIIEGPRTIANRKIREGMAPGSTPGWRRRSTAGET